MMKKITVREIAKRTGVAPVTVYRALSGESCVSVDKRRKIIRCAYKNGYNLPGNYCRNIAILVPHFRFFGYLAHMLFELEKELHRRDYRVQIIPQRDIQALGDHMFDGIISLVWQESEVLSLPHEYPIPIVSVNAAFSDSENIALVASSPHGMTLALNYLHDHGCRKIFFVGAKVDKNPIEAEKLAEFRTYCQSHGRNFETLHRSVAVTEIESVVPSVINAGADAVFCASETYAFLLGKQLLRRGIRIPEDISLMGMEEEELNSAFDPPITAIGQNFEKLAVEAVKMLEDEIERKLPGRNIRIPYTLIERSSVRTLS